MLYKSAKQFYLVQGAALVQVQMMLYSWKNEQFKYLNARRMSGKALAVLIT